jgi:membrane protease YdiL (CAAX protease family)
MYQRSHETEYGIVRPPSCVLSETEENMRQRLDSRDLRFLAICFLILLLTVWFSARFFYRAFPEASIDFRVTRGEARVLAEAFLRSQGHRVADYREASRFRYDDNAKTFLERELGLEEANRLMSTRVRLWQWSERWFRPLEKEEFRVDVTPRGEIVGFAHLVPEAAARPSLSPAQARALAEEFLRGPMHRDPSALDFVEGSSVTRPARTDHNFTWKERDFDRKGATYRLEVSVTGSEVAGYQEYLKVPETWQREYGRLRSRNNTTQSIDSAFMLLLVVGLLVLLLGFVRSHQVNWRLSAAVGLIGAALMFLSNWNSQPLAEFAYPTTDSYGSFLARQILQNLASSLAGGGFLFVLTAGAEALYRRDFPDRIALGHLFRPQGLRTKRFFLGAILGLTLTGIFVAYQTAFYLLAYRWGAWSPADVPYDDLLNTRFPWLFVLLGGFLPAVSEEFLFRMFAIPFLRKLVRSTVAALVLAGFIWGFGHAGYPQQPFYIRGVEVGIGGVVLGWVMLRWGILPTLIWHYSVDAMYSALLLLRSHNIYFILSGAATAGIMLLPVLIAWIAYQRGHGFEPETGLTNADQQAPAPPPPAPAPAAPTETVHLTWTARRRILALGLAVVALATLAVPVNRFGDEPRFRLSASQARASADAFLARQGFDRRGFETATYPITSWDADTGKYFLERRPVPYLARAYQRDIPLYGWVVRYFKPLDQEEWRVALDPASGSVFGFEHVVPEDRPGADLAPEEARQVASRYLADAGFDLTRLDLKETSTEKQKARRDHTLVWEARPGDARNLDEAHFRVTVEIDGDRVSSLQTSWKLPEAFVRQRSQRNALGIVLRCLRLLFLAAAMVAGLGLLIQRTRKHALRWRPALLVAAPLVLLGLIDSIQHFHLAFRNYDTAVPLGTFQASLVTGIVISLIAAGLGLTGAAGLLVSLQPGALAVPQTEDRRKRGLDALCAAVLAVGLAAAASHLSLFLLDRLHRHALPSVDAPAVFAVPFPALSAVSGAASQILFTLTILALLVHLAGMFPRLLWPALLLGSAAFVSSQVHTPTEFAVEYLPLLLAALALLAFCRWFGQRNHLAYALSLWSLTLGSSAIGFLRHPAMQIEGSILLVVLAAGVIWAVGPAVWSTGTMGVGKR